MAASLLPTNYLLTKADPRLLVLVADPILAADSMLAAERLDQAEARQQASASAMHVGFWAMVRTVFSYHILDVQTGVF